MFLSRDKIKVKITGRAGLKYVAGKKNMLINSEMLSGNSFDMVVYSNSISKWQPPYEHEEISSADKQQIINNIKTKLRHVRIDWQ